jgi:hypothetical protein
MTLFDSTKLAPSGPFIHATDALANKGQIVSFYHLLSGRSISLKAFVTAFNETYNCDWDSSTAYGRTDPVYVYKNAKRAITIGLKIPAATLSEGYENLLKLQNLIQFLYPKYKLVNTNSRTIGQSPLVRLRLMNLIKNQADTSGKTFKEIFTEGETKNSTTGLLGFIKNVAISHNLETDVGVLEGGNPSQQTGEIIPKLIEVTIDFTAIHEHHLGWRASTEFREGFFDNSSFPYGLDPGGANRLARLATATARRAAAEEEVATTRQEAYTWTHSSARLASAIAQGLEFEADRLQGIIDAVLVPEEDLLAQAAPAGTQADSDQAEAESAAILEDD